MVCLGAALPAAAQFRKPEDAIKHRQSVMTLHGHYVGPHLRDGQRPRARSMPSWPPTTPRSSRRCRGSPWVGFVEGTDKGETKAKPEIWKEKARFDETARKIQDDVAKLNAAAKTGNLDQIKAAVGAVGPDVQVLPRQLPEGMMSSPRRLGGRPERAASRDRVPDLGTGANTAASGLPRRSRARPGASSRSSSRSS